MQTLENLGTAELKKKQETEAELLRQNKVAREAPFKKYIDAFLYRSLAERLRNEPSLAGFEDQIPMRADFIVTCLKQAYDFKNGDYYGTMLTKEDVRNFEATYSAELNFINDAYGLVNSAKHELREKLRRELYETDDISYEIVLAQLQAKYGELV